MRVLIKRLYRERRRIVIVATAMFLGGYVAFFDTTTLLLGMPGPIIAGFAFMVGLAAPLMTLAVVIPKIRHSAETCALMIVALSLVGESFQPGARVVDVARRHGMVAHQLSGWRRFARQGLLRLPAELLPALLSPMGLPVDVAAEPAFVPLAIVPEPRALADPGKNSASFGAQNCRTVNIAAAKKHMIPNT